MDFLSSFFENIKSKLTNPFFGTLVVVLIFHHWELWYSLFNFDPGLTLSEKIEYITGLQQQELTVEKFAWDILYAAGTVLIGYLIVVGTRSLALFVEYKVMPFITGKVVSKKIIGREDYDIAIQERDEYFNKYESQRKIHIELSENFDSISSLLKERNEYLLKLETDSRNSLIELTDIKNELAKISADQDFKSAENGTLKNQLSSTSSSLKEYKNALFSVTNLFFSDENISFWNSVDKFPPAIISIVDELQKQNHWRAMMVIGDLHEGRILSVSTLYYDNLRKHGLINPYPSDKFSPIGEIIFFYRNLFNDYLTKKEKQKFTPTI